MTNFNENRLDPDDPRLTAYALGELEGDDADRVATAVAADPALQQAVDEIRDTAARLTAALEAEPLPLPVPPVRVEPYRTVRPARIFRWPYWGVAGLAAAASLAIIFALRERAWTQRPAPPALAEAAAPADAQASAAAQVQPSNHVEIQFPPKADRVATGATAADESSEQWGAVVPNPPTTGAKPLVVAATPAAPPAEAPAPVAGREQGGAIASSPPASAAKPAALTVAKAEAAPAAAAGSTEEVVTLSPFEVSSSSEQHGYTAVASLAGSRARSLSADGESPASGGFVRSGQPFNTESYDRIVENDFLAAAANPLSTFSVDVDTASYSNVRRFLADGRRPPRDAVRIEELVNYFTYDYAAPRPRDPAPLAASLEVAAAPWAPTHRLVRIGLKARELSTADRPAANLVFLVDVSGSMAEPGKLPLVKESLRMLVGKLKPGDRVAIAIYAGSSGLALPSTPAGHRQEILDAIDRLSAGGSTNGAMGIQLAYDIAKANFIPGGVNRVILATDGDFNIGVTNRGDLIRLIEEKARSGVFLTALGFGMGNLKDATLEELADRGNGSYAYIDSAREARKVLSEQVNGTLAVVARDVKAQVEFNPARVRAYRLIGYENRMLKAEDFNNDRIDAGDIGAGHTVTALYEVIPVGVAWKPDATVDTLKYQQPESSKPQTPDSKPSDELLTVKIRYQPPEGGASRRVAFPLVDHGTAFADASPDFKFAAAVAGFGLVLRDSPHRGAATLAAVEQWADEGTGSDAGGYRAEFIALVKRAEQVMRSQG